MCESGHVIGFTGVQALGKGHRGYAFTLTSLFNPCDFVTKETERHTISFKEGSKRLRKKMMESFELIKHQTGRMVKEFNIGKTHVCSQDYNPVQPLNWDTHGGLPVNWKKYEKQGFDGMIVLGCVIMDIIPQVILRTNKALCQMNQHSYAAGLAQSLIQYYLLQNPDGRLRSVTVEDLGNTTGKDELGSPASVIYVAYKLEPGRTNSRPAENIQVAGDAPPEQQKQEEEVDRKPNEIAIPDEDTSKSDTASSNPFQSSTPGKNLQDGSPKEKTQTKIKKITYEEKILFLRTYIKETKKDWDTIAEKVYEKRQKLTREIIEHYEQNLDKKTLKSRIKSYIMKVKKDKGVNEKNETVLDLIGKL